MRILIVGAGYLGRAVGRMLEAGGHEVVAVTRSGEDGSVACDVSVREEVARLLRCDAMVHCAASGRGGEEAYRAVYRDGCGNLVASFPGVPLVFTSSTSVYGQVDGSVVDEESEAEPERETGRLLREAEDIVMAAGGAVARLAGIYGPGRSVILKKFMEGAAVIEEDGRRYLNQIHRDDAAAAVVRMVEGRLAGLWCVGIRSL
jgi:nucleoside-diphosphate-sugar epimerase